ncbi:MAG TPA: ice-binding family protein [Frankiaceae bacterium]
MAATVRAVRPRYIALAAAIAAAVAGGAALGFPAASAAQGPVGLGTAGTFAVLAGSTVTNTGPSAISGNLGVAPGSAVTGFPPGVITNGFVHAADTLALQAQSALTLGYNDAAGRTPATTVSSDLGGQTLAPGVYQAAAGLGLGGTLTLDAAHDANAVFIFQAGSTLITASNSTVRLINDASPCNVYWQVGSSATLGTGSVFVGNVLALTSATVETGATVSGRVLARNGQVSLDTNVITAPSCAATPTPTPTATPTATPTGTPTGTPTAIVGPAGTPTSSAPTGGSSVPTGPSTATPVAPVPSPSPSDVVPRGAPATGAGGASHGRNGALLAVGVVGLFGAGMALRQARRRS